MAIVHVLDKQTDQIICTLNSNKAEYWDAKRKDTLDNINTFDLVANAKIDKSTSLVNRNRLLIQDEDGFFREFIISYAEQYKRSEKIVQSNASFVDLAKAKTVEPQTLQGATASTAIQTALLGTEWQPGIVDYSTVRTITIDEYTDPLSLLKVIESTFNLELRYRVEVNGNKVTGRYVDLVQQYAAFEGKEIVFGKDLIDVKRKEDASQIVTALLGLAPKQSDGTRLSVFIEDESALQRWGRNGQHLVATYEPESSNQDMTLSELTTLTKNELKKRIDSIVTYECNAASLEHIFGRSHEKIRVGQTVRIKDDGYQPPLYLEARIQEIEADQIAKKVLNFKIGSFIAYSKAALEAQIKGLKTLIAKKAAEFINVSILSSAGSIFKNGIGSTDLTAKVFKANAEDDIDGSKYIYKWTKYDKSGKVVTDWGGLGNNNKLGKTITVTSGEIDTKAVFVVEISINKVVNVAQITITNVSDGAKGDKGDKGDTGSQGVAGPKGADGQTYWTWIKYADTISGTGMSDDPTNKKYIGLAYNKTTSVESTTPTDYAWSLFQGPQGVQGPVGANGQPTYTWIKYADDSSGSGLSDSPIGKRYLGLAYNKTTLTESTNPADYAWSPLYDNVDVGGINLVRNTDFKKFNPNQWVAFGSYTATPSNVQDITLSSGEVIRFLKVASTSGLADGLGFGYTSGSSTSDEKFSLIAGKQYTLSFLVACHPNADSLMDYVYIMNDDSNPNQKLANVDITKKPVYGDFTSPYALNVYEYSLTFTAAYTCLASRVLIGSTTAIDLTGTTRFGLFYVARIMLEQGNIATKWKPAPEDGAGIHGITVGGSYTGAIAINRSRSGASNAGEIQVYFGTFTHPDGTVYVHPATANDGGIGTSLEGSNTDTEAYVLFGGSDSSRFPNPGGGDAFFAVVKYEDGWYFNNNSTWVAFTPNEQDCIVAKLTRIAGSADGIDSIMFFAHMNLTAFKGASIIEAGNINAVNLAAINANLGNVRIGDTTDGSLEIFADVNNDGVLDIVGRVAVDGAYYPQLQSDRISGNVENIYVDGNKSVYFEVLNGNDSNSGTSWTYPKKNLQAYIDALPKNLNGMQITLNVRNDVYGGIILDGFHNGNIFIIANTISGTRRPRLYGQNYMRKCGRGTYEVQGFDAHGDTSSAGNPIFRVENTDIAKFYDVKVYGNNKATHAFYFDNSKFKIDSCHAYGVTDRGLSASVMSHGILVNCKGSVPVAILTESGSIVTGEGTRWAGSIARLGNSYLGGNNTDVWAVNTGEATPTAPPEASEQLLKVSASTGDNWGTVYGWNSDEVRQGDYGYGTRFGIWYFDLSALRGKTIISATITLYRGSGGASAARTVYFRTHAYKTRSARPAGQPALSGVGATTTMAVGETKTVDITSMIQSNIASGTDNSIGVYTTGSTNYMTLGTTPTLVIRYK